MLILSCGINILASPHSRLMSVTQYIRCWVSIMLSQVYVTQQEHKLCMLCHMCLQTSAILWQTKDLRCQRIQSFYYSCLFSVDQNHFCLPHTVRSHLVVEVQVHVDCIHIHRIYACLVRGQHHELGPNTMGTRYSTLNKPYHTLF